MADYDYVVASGVIVPDAQNIKAEVEGEYLSVFGSDFVIDPNTPQGVLIAAEVSARQSVARNNATLANQINPNVAGGVFLDAIWALTGGSRLPATPSTVTATIAGVAGTLVPAGSQAQTAAGDVFQLTSGVTIPGGGSIDGIFQSVASGPIPIGAGALNQIVTNVIGWETVTNATAGTVGQSTETDAASRLRRRQTIGIQSKTTAQAVMSRVMAVTGVKSMTFLENIATTTQTIQTISMVRNSIWACVSGGVDADVALALLQSKSAGTAFNGGTSVSVTDPVSGQAYTVLFDRPTAVPILIRVTVRANSSVSNPTAAVVQAVTDYANGLVDGEAGLVVGEDVSPFEIGAAVNYQVPALYVKQVEVATVASGVYQTTTLDIAINKIATIGVGAVTVVIS